MYCCAATIVDLKSELRLVLKFLVIFKSTPTECIDVLGDNARAPVLDSANDFPNFKNDERSSRDVIEN